MAAAKQSFQVMRVNHKEKVTEALELMFADESLTDVTICCCGQQVKAHRVILAASSNYFKEIFAATLPGQYPIVFLKSVTLEDLHAILEFVYKGEVTVPREQMESLVSSAECLGVMGLGSMDLESDPNFNSCRFVRSALQPSTLDNKSSAASSPSRSDGNLNEGPKNDSSKGSTLMPKKRGKKRKIFTAEEEEQSQKEAKTSSSKKTNGHSNGNEVNSSPQSSSPQSTSSSSSTSTRKSAQPQATISITNGHHKGASSTVSSKQAGTSSEPMDDVGEATDEELQKIKEEPSESSSSARTRKNSMTLKPKSKRMNGYRARSETVVQEQQQQQLPPSRNSTPSIDSDVEIEISGRYGFTKMDEQHRTSNGSLDLSRKSATPKLAVDTERQQSRESTPVASSKAPLSASSNPVKTVVTKSKLRSWSQQISQSAGPVNEQTPPSTSSPPSAPKGLVLSKSVPQINLTAIKNGINGQLVAASGSNSPSTSYCASPNVFNTKAMSTFPVDEEKPVITLPPHIKMEARPRGRPRKAITEKAAIVPRPLNPLLGLARSSLAAKVAKAAASATVSKESSSEPVSIDCPSVSEPSTSAPSTPAPVSPALSTTSAPATPVAASLAPVSNSVTSSPPSEKSNQQEPVNEKSTSESTPTVPVMRVSRISPSSSHTVTIVNGSGDIVSTVTASGSSSANSSSPHSPTFSSASSCSSADLNVEQTPLMTTAGGKRSSSGLPLVKKRRGRPPSMGNQANLKPNNMQQANQEQLRVPSLTLKISNKFANIFKPHLSAGGSSSSKPIHQSSSVITSFSDGGSSSSTPTYTFASSANIPLSSNNPSSLAHAPVQPRPSSAQSMATISSDRLAFQGDQEFPVPRFTPIVASSSAAADVTTAAAPAKENMEKSSEQATPETVII